LSEQLKSKEEDLKVIKQRAKEDLTYLQNSETELKKENTNLNTRINKLGNKLKKTEEILKNTQNEV